MATNLGAKIFRGAAYGGLNLVLSALVMLIATPLILRALGDTGYGLNGLLLAAFGVLNLLSFGGQEATLYFSSKKESQAHARVLGLWHLLAAGLGLGLLWGGGKFLGLGAFLGLKLDESQAFDAALAAGASLWATQFFCNWLWNLCRAHLRFGLLYCHQAVISVLVPTIGLVAAHVWGGLVPFLWGEAAVWAGGVIVLLPWMPELFVWEFRVSLNEIWTYARWALVFNLSIVALQSSDRFFTVSFGATAVAAYTIASALYQRGMSAFGLVPTLLVPAISRMEDGDIERAKKTYGLSLRFGMVLALAGFLPLMGLGDVFLRAWLPGHEALADRAYLPLALLSAAGCMGTLCMMLHAVLLGLGRAKQVALTGVVGAALGYGLAWLALPSLGFVAAALCGLGGYTAIYVLRLWISERRVFGRALLPMAFQHGIMLLGASAAVFLLRLLSRHLMGQGLLVILPLLAVTGLIFMALGLGADAYGASRLGRESVVDALSRIVRHAAA